MHDGASDTRIQEATALLTEAHGHIDFYIDYVSEVVPPDPELITLRDAITAWLREAPRDA